MRAPSIVGRIPALLALALVALSAPARAQQAGSNAAANAAVNFSNPPRDYREVRLGAWTVMVETEMLAREPQLGQRALARLEAKLGEMLVALPKSSHADLQGVQIYVLYGQKASLGGWSNGASYYQRTAPDNQKNLDPQWRNVFVLKSAENYVALSELWALKVLVHEFAHAQQLLHWPEKQPDILAAWEHAKSEGLYRNVTDDKGKHFDEAYALTNQLEYYAELSCMYFVRCNYPPTNRLELKAYDPTGYAMVEKMWNVADGRDAATAAPGKLANAGKGATPRKAKADVPRQTKPPAEPAAKEFRTWTDSTGQNRTEAEFAGLAFGKVKLRKRDGSVVSVPLERLSDADREWIERRNR